MIEDSEVKRLSCAGELSRRSIVGVARPAVAAWMIVGQDHTGTTEPGRVGHDLAHRQSDRGRFALILFDMDAARLAVDVRYQQLLVRFPSAIEAGGKKPPRSLMAVQERG